MTPQHLTFVAGLLLTVFPAATAFSETTIVVNFGPYGSAQAAGHAEAEVDWLDADRTDDVACTECFGALELQHYLRKMTSREKDFEIRDDRSEPAGDWILIGGPESNALARRVAPKLNVTSDRLIALGPQGYRIKSGTVDGRQVTLVAGSDRIGTLYGVYDLLHRLGVRWFGPEAFQEEIPLARWIMTWDVAEKPDFIARGFMAWQPRGSKEFLLWMARNRLNEWTIECPHHDSMRKLGIKMFAGNHDTLGLLFHPDAEYPYNHAAIQGDESKPADPYPRSPLFKGDVNRDGKLSYAEAQPQWQGLFGGKRIGKIRKGTFGNHFCTSNPDACREFFKNYVEAVTKGAYRGADAIRFWMLDRGKWCECDACKALGTPTDRNLLLVHQLDNAFKEARRNGLLNRQIPIRFLVYAEVLSPPTRPLPQNFDYSTCTATFYPIRRCYVHQFDDPTCETNQRYADMYRGWFLEPSRHYRGNVVIGEYYNVSKFRSLPICFMHGMAHDIPYYHENRARAFQYMHVTTGRWGNKSLTNYQMARQLWDVDTHCETLWRDYFARRYGPVADTMHDFYKVLEHMFSNIDQLKESRHSLAYLLNRGVKDLFPDPHLQFAREPGDKTNGPTLVEMVEAGKQCRELINRAMAANVPERIRQRLIEDERQFTYGERTLNYYYHCATSFRLLRQDRRDAARHHLTEAKRIARLLERDTWSMRLCYIEKSKADHNGLTCTDAVNAIRRLEKLLADKDPKPK
ncbi:MAG: DUF4838 domain-containing protein [Pirellulales bacterium]|nr:DUF4838 domain-containing protein [Pirellulales bacterium]